MPQIGNPTFIVFISGFITKVGTQDSEVSNSAGQVGI